MFTFSTEIFCFAEQMQSIRVKVNPPTPANTQRRVGLSPIPTLLMYLDTASFCAMLVLTSPPQRTKRILIAGGSVSFGRNFDTAELFLAKLAGLISLVL